jgi:hypothetical protein
MSEQLDLPAGSARYAWAQLGRLGLISTLTALGAVAAMFLLRPG